MDPDANLREQLEIARLIQKNNDNGFDARPEDAARLAELVIALNEWILKGGFLPVAWRK